jgi:hypothetical protein
MNTYNPDTHTKVSRARWLTHGPGPQLRITDTSGVNSFGYSFALAEVDGHKVTPLLESETVTLEPENPYGKIATVFDTRQMTATIDTWQKTQP